MPYFFTSCHIFETSCISFSVSFKHFFNDNACEFKANCAPPCLFVFNVFLFLLYFVVFFIVFRCFFIVFLFFIILFHIDITLQNNITTILQNNITIIYRIKTINLITYLINFFCVNVLLNLILVCINILDLV